MQKPKPHLKSKKQIMAVKTVLSFTVVVFSFSFLFLSLGEANAQEHFSLSITPALFQVSLNPGEVWNSELKIVNTNTRDLQVYASPLNFKSGNERGRPQFIPVTEEDPEAIGSTLAGWIDITEEPITIPVDQSVEVPFSIELPEDASPGGHYAAILVGTQPVKQTDGPSTLVSSFVSSLMFVRVQGDVIEDGFIREFSTDEGFYQKHEVDFSLEFQNTGNVHIRPAGDIVIYNMWGKKRGEVPINQAAGFGNVLPDSSRTFDFDWKGEYNVFDIGRYRADVTLTFGENMRQSKTTSVYFWIVPVRSTLGFLAGFLAAIGILVVSIRWYIQRAFKMQAAALGLAPEALSRQQATAAPVASKGAGQARDKKIQKSKKDKMAAARLKNLKRNYKLMVIGSILLVTIVAAAFFFRAALIPERSFEIIIEKQGTSTGVQLQQ